MPQALRYQEGRKSELNQQAGVGMSEIMQPYPLHSGHFNVLFQLAGIGRVGTQ